MKNYTGLAIVSLILSYSPSVFGSMLGFKECILDFTKPKEIQKKARWNDSDKMNITGEGLGWDGQSNASRDVRIQTTELIAVGWSWRSVSAVTVTAKIEPPGKFEFGKNSIVYPYGELYTRYSPDGKHWSSWNYLEIQQPKNKENSEQLFRGTLRIPYQEREVYQDWRRKYSQMDVPWASDEEAAVRWILKNDPKFFEKFLPFIGYVQFLFETQLRGGQRLKRIDIQISYGAGGTSSIPKNKEVKKSHIGSWRFKAE